MDVVSIVAAVLLGVAFVVAGASKLAAGADVAERRRSAWVPRLARAVRAVGRAGGRRCADRPGRQADPAASWRSCCCCCSRRLIAKRLSRGQAPAVRLLRGLVGEADRARAPRAQRRARLLVLSSPVAWRGQSASVRACVEEEATAYSRLVAPGVVAAARAGVAGAHLGAQQRAAASLVRTSRSLATHFAGSW